MIYDIEFVKRISKYKRLLDNLTKENILELEKMIYGDSKTIFLYSPHEQAVLKRLHENFKELVNEN